MDFKRQPKPLVWVKLYLVRPVKPHVTLKAYIENIYDLGINTRRYSLRKLLRVTISDVFRVYKYGKGFGLV